MASEKYIIIPGTQQRIYDGTVVMLHRLPNLRWIIHNGYYTYNGKKTKGWYFSSIPSDTTMPVFNEDLMAMTIIDDPDPFPGPPIPPPHPPHPPGPIQIPFTPEDKRQIDAALITVKDLAARDMLGSRWTPNGKVVRVNDIDGEGTIDYFSWNAETSTWEPASFGYRYMTREEIEQATADDIISIEWSNEEGALVLGRHDAPIEKVMLNGVAHDPVYTAEDLQLTIPRYGMEDLVVNIPHDNYIRSIRFEQNYTFPDGHVGPAIVVVVSDGTTEHEVAGDATGLIDVYQGGQTDTIDVSIPSDDRVVRAYAKISTRPNNRLKVDEEGLYVDVSDLEDQLDEVTEAVTWETFE